MIQQTQEQQLMQATVAVAGLLRQVCIAHWLSVSTIVIVFCNDNDNNSNPIERAIHIFYDLVTAQQTVSNTYAQVARS